MYNIELIKLKTSNVWRHCPFTEKPADLLTREVTAQTLASKRTWFNGRTWINKTEEEWPHKENIPIHEQEKQVTVTNTVNVKDHYSLLKVQW